VVEFQPKSTSSFSTNLTIKSNDPKTPTFNLPLNGSQEDISILNVRINQVETFCPPVGSGVVTAYVSVTDQGGYPVTVLGINNFSVTEIGGYLGEPNSVPFVENTASISAALVMDFSRSVGPSIPDMVAATSMFIDQMKESDEAEIIKFSQIYEVVQPFTPDKNLLMDAVNAPWDGGVGSVVFDTVWQAVIDTAAPERLTDRKAVILISDGWDFSTSVSLDNLIDFALSKNVPIFTIGLGSNIILENLTRMADETGGQYYSAANSDNLKTVHQQLADVLFTHQYILTYTSGLVRGSGNADLTIGASLSTAIPGNHTKGITACP
jgi:VWFA-related protein